MVEVVMSVILDALRVHKEEAKRGGALGEKSDEGFFVERQGFVKPKSASTKKRPIVLGAALLLVAGFAFTS